MLKITDRHCQPRLAGKHVPKFIVRMLARLYPSVRLVWNPGYERWQLVEKTRRGWQHIRFLMGPVTPGVKDVGEFQHPTVANTVGVLQACDALRMLKNSFQRDAFLAELDGTFNKARSDIQIYDRINDGSREVERAMRGRVCISPKPTRKGVRKAWLPR